MVSKKLMGVWAFLDVALLAGGAFALAMSLIWRAPDMLRHLVLSDSYLNAGLAVGISMIITFFISIGGIVQKNHVTIGLVILNYCLVAEAIIVLVIGTFLWYFSLQERANFHEIWAAQTSDTRIKLQDTLNCCGYFNGTDLAEIGGSHCASQSFVDGLNVTDESNFCVSKMTSYGDNILLNVFTTIYGFMAIVLCLLLATICVIKKRDEDERFKKIDAKRGGKGFV
ncbi:uncharacterized protein SCHCODRAFT_02607132 [Schizophyllum commune H4-8]|uniref:Tetraspanin n=1 Tax=Schizophyllum commune (strain H4-8 / FGSC 9210) TaxID=578458 RepID=D8PW00_SCHCM|nr:uncharacterized protein SCHCODRAFT_02607132 [Schizophyllum commune H4-8]KAI5900145.1 hypothetical protein SCHCODRAFT_02607132 [Schizophyllum commune H4-8]